MIIAKEYLSQYLTKELFVYKDNNLYWKEKSGTRDLSKAAGYVNKYGYRRINYKNKMYASHRLIWIMFNGNITDLSLEVDHINGIRYDNRIENIRLVTRSHNQCNRNNVKGYSWNNLKLKWISRIKINGKTINLGYFSTKEEAHQSYLDAKKIYHVIN